MKTYGRAPVHYPSDDEQSGQAECFFVEGDSAAKSVDQVRKRSHQAIVALQGKPLNANRASLHAATRNKVFIRCAEAMLGKQPGLSDRPEELLPMLQDPANCIYQRIILLMDPDADGIHCGVLMMGFFQRFASGLIEAGRLFLVRPPMYIFRFPVSVFSRSQWPVASSPEHAVLIENVLRDRGVTGYKKIKHRGLGSLDATTLKRFCVDPETRQASCLDADEIDAAIMLFGGQSRDR